METNFGTSVTQVENGPLLHLPPCQSESMSHLLPTGL